MTIMIDSAGTEAWREIQRAAKPVRLAERARELGLTEAELVASGCGAGVVRLKTDGPALIRALRAVGRIMAVTRSSHAASEQFGSYGQLRQHGAVGVVTGPINQRLIFERWHHVFAIIADGPGIGRALKVYDRDGALVLTLLPTPATDLRAFDALADRLAGDQEEPVRAEPYPPSAPDPDDAAVDVAGFRQDWSRIRDVHEAGGVIARHRLGRAQAYRLLGSDFAERLDPAGIGPFLASLAEGAVTVALFVGNPGCIQVQMGKVGRAIDSAGFHNVIDPDFHLHLKADGIDQAWVVRTPTASGVSVRVDLLDRDGGSIAAWFGLRDDPATPAQAWLDAVAALPRA